MLACRFVWTRHRASVTRHPRINVGRNRRCVEPLCQWPTLLASAKKNHGVIHPMPLCERLGPVAESRNECALLGKLNHRKHLPVNSFHTIKHLITSSVLVGSTHTQRWKRAPGAAARDTGAILYRQHRAYTGRILALAERTRGRGFVLRSMGKACEATRARHALVMGDGRSRLPLCFSSLVSHSSETEKEGSGLGGGMVSVCSEGVEL